VIATGGSGQVVVRQLVGRGSRPRGGLESFQHQRRLVSSVQVDSEVGQAYTPLAPAPRCSQMGFYSPLAREKNLCNVQTTVTPRTLVMEEQ